MVGPPSLRDLVPPYPLALTPIPRPIPLRVRADRDADSANNPPTRFDTLPRGFFVAGNRIEEIVAF